MDEKEMRRLFDAHGFDQALKIIASSKEVKKPRTVMLGDSDVSRLKAIGGGNLSKGVRITLDAYNSKPGMFAGVDTDGTADADQPDARDME